MVEGMGGVGRRRVGAGGGSRREREGKGGGSRGGGAGTASQLRTRRAYVSHPLFAWVSRKLWVLTVHSIKHLYPLELSLTHAHKPLSPMDESTINELDFEGFEGPHVPNVSTQMSNTGEIPASNIQMSNTESSGAASRDPVDQNSHRPKRRAALRNRFQSQDDFLYY